MEDASKKVQHVQVKSNFAKNLKELMQKHSVTAKELSRKTGVPTSTLSEWLGGRVPRLSDDAVKVAQVLGVSLEFLVTGTSAEENIVKEVFSSAGKEFVSIHNGVYRIQVEKYVETPKKKE